MIKQFLEKYFPNTYQRNPPSIEDKGFCKYLNREVQFYRSLAEQSQGNVLTHKYYQRKGK